MIQIPVQVNGKLKAVVEVEKEASEEVVKQKVSELETLNKVLEGKQIIKQIYVKGKIFNIVVK